MEEWTPYTHIDPPHLHGFLVSEGGQFLLTPLADGGTRVEGNLVPAWALAGRILADVVGCDVHRIHFAC